MKNLTILFLFMSTTHIAITQSVGIGTSTPDSSAVLDVSSTTKGLLIPRMTTAQRDAIVDPVDGLMILNLDDRCIDIYNGTHWTKNCGWT